MLLISSICPLCTSTAGATIILFARAWRRPNPTSGPAAACGSAEARFTPPTTLQALRVFSCNRSP